MDVTLKPLRPSHLSLAVGDLATSEAFYRDVLGLSPEKVDGDLHFRCAGFHIVLTETPPAGRSKFHFGFRVDSPEEVDGWAERAKKYGARVDSPHDRDGGRVVFINDPDDYVIEIYYE